MQKNVTGQKWIVFAFDITDNSAKTGDAAQITGNLRIDGAAADAIDDTNPTELEDGYYSFDITQAETNGDQILIAPASSTSNIQVIGVPGVYDTTAPNANALGIESDGDLTKVNLVATTTTNTDMVGTDDAALASTLSTKVPNNLNTTASGNIGIDWANVENPTTALDLSGTDIQLADTVTDLTNTVTVGTNNDKTGYALSATGLDLILVTSTFVAALIKGVWDRLLTGATHNIASSAGKRLREVAGEIFTEGQAQSGGNNTIQLASGDVTINEQFARAKVIIIGGTGAGQENIITSSVASTDTLTVAIAWLVNPDSSSEYQVMPGQVHATVRNGGYDNGCVYVNTVTGTSGTQKGVNGTTTNPVDNLIDAYVIAAQEKLDTFCVEPGSTITLPSDSSFKTFTGAKYFVLLNNKKIEGTTFLNSDSITGLSTGGATPPLFRFCAIGTCTIPPSGGFQCAFFGVVTFQSAGAFTFGGSAPILNSTPIFDYGASLNASSLDLPTWAGKVEVQNAGQNTGTYTLNVTGDGDLTINANCSSTFEVDLHGNVSYTNNASGISISESANITSQATAANLQIVDDNVDTINTNVGTAGAGLSDLAGMSTAMKAEVNAEVVDVIDTDTTVELSSVPAATSSLRARIGWLFLKARNKITQTATTQLVRNDGDSGTVGTSTDSDNGTTATRGKYS